LAPSPPLSLLAPYTTLFRSIGLSARDSLKINTASETPPVKSGPSTVLSPKPTREDSISPYTRPPRPIVASTAPRQSRGHFHLCRDRKSTRLNSSHQIMPYAV